MLSPSTLRILIVEDDRCSRFVLRRMLEALGKHEIHEAEDGQNAWDKLTAGLLPDLCFLDIDMPRMGGIELLRLIRSEPDIANLRVCFCSAVRDKQLIVKAASLRPDGYILKPCSREAISSHVQRALGTPAPSDSLEPMAAVCSRLGIDPGTYRSGLDSLLREVREATVRLPTLLMRSDVSGAITSLKRIKAQAYHLGARRLFKLQDALLRVFDANGHLLASNGGQREQSALQFQQWLSRSADHLMDTIQELRAEVQVIERLTESSSKTDGSASAAGAFPGDRGDEVELLVETLTRVLSAGKLITLKRSARSKSLTIPIKSSLLGQDAAETLGALTRKTSFSLAIPDPATAKAVDGLRKVTSLIKLFSFPWDATSRWIPATAIPLLASEIAARNAKAVELLRNAIGPDLDAFLLRQETPIRRQLGLVLDASNPAGKDSEVAFKAILEDVRSRLSFALEGGLAVEPAYADVDLSDLSEIRDDNRWSGPCSLLCHAALLQRNASEDPSPDAKLEYTTFDRAAYLSAMNIFNDPCVLNPNAQQAENVSDQIRTIVGSLAPQFEKCRLVWGLTHA